jgi:hypothetical protein
MYFIGDNTMCGDSDTEIVSGLTRFINAIIKNVEYFYRFCD